MFNMRASGFELVSELLIVVIVSFALPIIVFSVVVVYTKIKEYFEDRTERKAREAYEELFKEYL